MDKAISPLDGRYGKRLAHLGAYFSEYALMRMRVRVELLFVRALDNAGLFPPLKATERKAIEQKLEQFDEHDYRRIKEIEAEINHDVKACEVYLRETLELSNPNMIHFGLTSEDVNNLSYSLLLKEYLEQEHLPQLEQLLKLLAQKAHKWCALPFPARTHGQMASPSTGGKEMAVFLNRLWRAYQGLKAFRFRGKLNGATGTYSALLAAFPDYDWITFSKNFLQSLGLESNPATTQIEDHDSWGEYFAISKQIANIILDLDRDMWLYLTLGYLVLEADAGAVGSSTMPHKVNPINFENSEGNLQISVALLNGIMDKLGQSRLQRDLSDSTVERNMGVALAHSYLALQETIKGLKRLQINQARCLAELREHPELLAEPIQTILRREGFENPYNLLKEITRGKRVTFEDLQQFIRTLDVAQDVKEELLTLKVEKYTGLAEKICREVLERIEGEMGSKY